MILDWKITLPTLPGKVHGIVADDPLAVQCSRCLRTCTDSSDLAAVRWALFTRGAHAGERLCADCRRTCGCESCRRTGR